MTMKEVLELAGSATSRYRTFRCVLRDWSNYRVCCETQGECRLVSLAIRDEPQTWRWLDGKPSVADASHYLIDLERGVLLSAVALVGGAPAVIEETTEVAFDELFEPALFDGANWGVAGRGR